MRASTCCETVSPEIFVQTAIYTIRTAYNVYYIRTSSSSIHVSQVLTEHYTNSGAHTSPTHRQKRNFNYFMKTCDCRVVSRLDANCCQTMLTMQYKPFSIRAVGQKVLHQRVRHRHYAFCVWIECCAFNIRIAQYASNTLAQYGIRNTVFGWLDWLAGWFGR